MIIEIPGDILEGGGQILRTSLALSALLSKGIRIRNIRAKRSPPGLKAQHLTSIKAVAALSKAVYSNLEIGSSEFTFEPSTRIGGTFKFDVGTAGSISLVIQALMPTTAFAHDTIDIEVTGGTDVRWSPTIDYLRLVKLPILAKMGYKAQIRIIRRGHYPKGGGKVRILVEPIGGLTGVELIDQCGIKDIGGVSHCVRLPKHIAERQARKAEDVLRESGYSNTEIDLEWHEMGANSHFGPGSGITLYASTGSNTIIGADALGERGKSAEKVGLTAAEKLITEIKSGMAIDRHLADMLIPYMAVAKGYSRISTSEITLHTITNIRITEMMAGVKFKVEGELGKPGSIGVEGISLAT